MRTHFAKLFRSATVLATVILLLSASMPVFAHAPTMVHGSDMHTADMHAADCDEGCETPEPSPYTCLEHCLNALTERVARVASPSRAVDGQVCADITGEDGCRVLCSDDVVERVLDGYFPLESTLRAHACVQKLE